MKKIFILLSITWALGLYAQTNLAPVGAVWHYGYNYSFTDIVFETVYNYRKAHLVTYKKKVLYLPNKIWLI